MKEKIRGKYNKNKFKKTWTRLIADETAVIQRKKVVTSYEKRKKWKEEWNKGNLKREKKKNHEE